MSTTDLKTQTVKDLAEMAKKKGVLGWHSMRKDQLIRALAKHSKNHHTNGVKPGKSGGKKTNGAPHSGKNGDAVHLTAAQKARATRLERRLKQIRAKLAHSKDLAMRSAADTNGGARDRMVVMVRDPYWLQVYWEITRQSVERARVAMGQHWHGARPMIRLHEISADGTASAHCVVRHIEVHGGVNTWYVDVQDPPKTYQMDIGYQAPCGKFFSLSRSNVVTTPQTTVGGAFDHNWAGVAQDCDRIYALSGGFSGEHHASEDLREVFEEHLRRPMGAPVAARFGLHAGNGSDHDFNFMVDAELVVYGATDPGAQVTLRGEPVPLEADGSFMVRFNLPDRRQVLPIVASSGDGGEQRTIVLAVERNTKVMEPVVRDSGD